MVVVLAGLVGRPWWLPDLSVVAVALSGGALAFEVVLLVLVLLRLRRGSSLSEVVASLSVSEDG